MPIYEYVCQDCGTRLDALRSMKDADSPVHCKNCLGLRTTRQLSIFYSKSAGSSAVSQSSGTASSGGCSGCSGGSCASCRS